MVAGFVVSREEEVGIPDCFCLDPVDLSHFFEEDGKIYGYQGLNVRDITYLRDTMCSLLCEDV